MSDLKVGAFKVGATADEIRQYIKEKNRLKIEKVQATLASYAALIEDYRVFKIKYDASNAAHRTNLLVEYNKEMLLYDTSMKKCHDECMKINKSRTLHRDVIKTMSRTDLSDHNSETRRLINLIKANYTNLRKPVCPSDLNIQTFDGWRDEFKNITVITRVISRYNEIMNAIIENGVFSEDFEDTIDNCTDNVLKILKILGFNVRQTSKTTTEKVNYDSSGSCDGCYHGRHTETRDVTHITVSVMI
jgi:hypothetical protein